MVDREKVDRLLVQLRIYTGYLARITEQDRQAYLDDPRSTGAARYYPQLSIETCIGIANHIIATEGLRAPADYKDTFRVLDQAGILTPDVAGRMRELAGLRNLLVHVYTEVDDALIYESVRSETVDFGVFAAQVLDYVDANSHP